jgi:NDP-sugar pyrophosphorylase family protein
MDALLLCAGLGTRLRPLTEERPKPLVPVLDRPLAAFAIDHLAAAGVRRVVANAHHLAEQIEPALSPLCAARGASLAVLREATLLGTGGAIRNALAAPGRGVRGVQRRRARAARPRAGDGGAPLAGGAGDHGAAR